MSYIHFTEKEIYAIEIYKKEGYNHSQIAKKLNKCHTSINRLVAKYSSLKTGIFYASLCIKQRKELKS